VSSPRCVARARRPAERLCGEAHLWRAASRAAQRLHHVQASWARSGIAAASATRNKEQGCCWPLAGGLAADCSKGPIHMRRVLLCWPPLAAAVPESSATTPRLPPGAPRVSSGTACVAASPRHYCFFRVPRRRRTFSRPLSASSTQSVAAPATFPPLACSSTLSLLYAVLLDCAFRHQFFHNAVLSDISNGELSCYPPRHFARKN